MPKFWLDVFYSNIIFQIVSPRIKLSIAAISVSKKNISLSDFSINQLIELYNILHICDAANLLSESFVCLYIHRCDFKGWTNPL